MGEFAVGWSVAVTETVEAEDADAAGRAALRRARERLAGSCLARVEWEAPRVEAVG